MTKKTAVDFLIKEIKNDQFLKSKNAKEWNEIFDKAKEMEKEQIKDAYNDAAIDATYGEKFKNFEQYYNETYEGENE